MKRWFLLLLLLAGATGVYFLVDSGAEDHDRPRDPADAGGGPDAVLAPAPDREPAPPPVREAVGDQGAQDADPSGAKKPLAATTIDGARVEGRVTDGLGRPLSGVTVSLLALEGALLRVPRELGRTTTSGADGSFAFGDLPSGVGLAVRAEARGLARVEREFEPPAPGATRGGVELRLDPAITLSGTVTDQEGRPVAGASVVAQLARDGSLLEPDSPFSARTDERGAYSISGLARTLYRVSARADGYAPTTTEKTLLAVALRPEAKLDLVLDLAAGRAEGRVVADDGTPVGAARIEATANGHEVATESDASGRFRLEGLANRTYTAIARAAKTFPRAPAPIRPGDSDVVLRVGRNGSLAGRASPAHGAPPARIAVELLRIERSESVVARAIFESAEFRFEDLAEGEYRVAIECDDARRTESEPIRVAAGAEADLGAVELQIGGTVVVRIEGAVDGTPLSLVPGDLSPANPNWMQRAIFAPPERRATARGGGARFEHVAPGAYTLFVVPEKGLPAIARGIVVRDGETTTATTGAPRAGASIRGRAFDPLGVAVTGREAIASSERGEFRVHLDEEGYFAFAALEPGTWSVTLAADASLRGRPRPVFVKLNENDAVEIEVRVEP